MENLFLRMKLYEKDNRLAVAKRGRENLALTMTQYGYIPRQTGQFFFQYMGSIQKRKLKKDLENQMNVANTKMLSWQPTLKKHLTD